MNKPENTGVDRRTIVKSAAWTAPVVAAAIAAPLASASTTNADVYWDGATTLISLELANGQQLATASLLPSGPNNFYIANGTGSITGPITGTITVELSGGLSVSIGRLKGFEPESIQGATITNQTEYNTGTLFLNSSVGTVTNFTIDGDIASDELASFLVNWGVTESGGSIASLGALATYTVTLELFDGAGNLIDRQELSQITSLVGAAIFG